MPIAELIEAPRVGRGGRAWSGRLGARRALIAVRRRHGEARAWVAVSGRYGGPVVVERGDGEMWLGDPAFDHHARVRTQTTGARAALSEPVRVRVLRLLALGAERVRWAAHGLSVEAPEDVSPDRGAALADAISDLARLVEARPPGLEGLLATALEDPEVRVRAAAAEALLGALREEAPGVVARACAALAASPRVRPRLRVDALWTVEAFARSHAGGVLEGLVGVEEPRVLACVLERLGALGHRGALPELARAAHHPEAEIAAAALDALGSLGAPELEPLVMERLFGGPPAVQEAAARALGRIGEGQAAARALRRVLAARRLDPGLRRAAARALDALQLRLPPAGALALPSFYADAGSVSLTLDMAELEDEAQAEDDPLTERRAWLFDQTL